MMYNKTHDIADLHIFYTAKWWGFFIDFEGVCMSNEKIVNELIANEEKRQIEKIGLIPSENNASPEVQAVLSSCLSNKYSEGYSGRR